MPFNVKNYSDHRRMEIFNDDKLLAKINYFKCADTQIIEDRFLLVSLYGGHGECDYVYTVYDLSKLSHENTASAARCLNGMKYCEVISFEHKLLTDQEYVFLPAYPDNGVKYYEESKQLVYEAFRSPFNHDVSEEEHVQRRRENGKILACPKSGQRFNEREIDEYMRNYDYSSSELYCESDDEEEDDPNDLIVEPIMTLQELLNLADKK